MTSHQMNVLTLIVGGDPAYPSGKPDIYFLLEKATRKVMLQSMQATLRVLIHYEIVAKGPKELRDGRKVMVYSPTELGKAIAGGGKPVYAFVGTEDDDPEA